MGWSEECYVMDWSYKFAFDEIEEMMENRPWLLVDDDFASADNDAFLGIQKQLMLARGWDWFARAIRGRVYPKLGLTTMTAWDREHNPDQGDVDPESVAKVQQKFPGISVVSLVGLPHVVSGPPLGQDVLSRIGTQAQRWHRGLNKTADDNESDFSTPYYKDEFQFEIADVDRYATDKYFANLTLQETDKLYSIGFQMYNYQVGITGSVQYWHYEKNELSQAKKTFKELKRVLAKTMSKIEFHRPPMAVITPMVRAAFQPIDLRHKERSGNYFYNWFEELSKEPDWRTTLYGNRYPAPVIQTIEAFWRADDEGKEITTKGNSSRSRVLLYKPSCGMIPKYAANQDRLRQLWKDSGFGRGFAGGAGAGAALIWLMSYLSPMQIQRQMENGVSPEEIMTQVMADNPSLVPPAEPEISTPDPAGAAFNADLAENPANSLEMVDNSLETDKMSRGLRNNNPGNIERNNTAWQGMSEDQTDERFITFDSPEYGIRAMARVLKNYGRRHGLRTIEQIIGRWAPASENQTNSYIQHVSQELSIPPATPLNLDDDALLGRLIRAIIEHENGTSPYDDETIARGVQLEKTSATTTGVFRHSYREIDQLKLRQLNNLYGKYVRELARDGFSEQQVGKALADMGVSSDSISLLIAGVFRMAENTWNYKYADANLGRM